MKKIKTAADIFREKLVNEWGGTSRKLFKRNIPKTSLEAGRRFKCNKLNGGACELKGEHCAKRHLSAIATIDKIERRPDWQCKLVRSDDVTCSTCLAGSARARLLRVSFSGVRTRRQKQQQQDRHTFLDLGDDDHEYFEY